MFLASQKLRQLAPAVKAPPNKALTTTLPHIVCTLLIALSLSCKRRPILREMNAVLFNNGRGNEEFANLPRKINVCISPTRDDFPHTQVSMAAAVDAFLFLNGMPFCLPATGIPLSWPALQLWSAQVLYLSLSNSLVAATAVCAAAPHADQRLGL
jgi:hypothetical protein